MCCFCLKKRIDFSQTIKTKVNLYPNLLEQIIRNWNVGEISVLIISRDITYRSSNNVL